MDFDDYRANAQKKYQKLSHTQELDFALRILRNEDEAIYLLADPYLIYALRYAEQYHQTNEFKHFSIEDIIKAANKGLYRAAKEYSAGEGKNFRFKDYSAWWIKQSIGSLRAEKQVDS